jgi:site-specific DNA-methyltransferase (adenine-specific)
MCYGGYKGDGYEPRRHTQGRYPANIILDGSDSVEALFPNETQRFFYHAKASKADRDEGVNGMNTHATVKPTQLMRHLVKLVTPHGGLVLDPFMGSGSTGKACMLEGMRFIGMELSEEYIKIAEARIEHAYNQVRLLHA